MREKLTKIGNATNLILSRELLDLLGLREGAEAEVELVGNTIVGTAPDTGRTEIEAGLAYLASKRERAEVYRRLTQVSS